MAMTDDDRPGPEPTVAGGVPEPADAADSAALDRANALLDRASTELSASTDRDPSPGLLPAVMQTVRAELRPGRLIPLPGSDGTLLVTETAVGNALVAHLDGLPELLVRRCTVRHQESTGQRPGSLDVALTAAVAYGTQTGDLVNRIRSIISVGAQQLFGLVVGHVDVEFVDVYPAAGTPR
jgi:hypothetical protein